MGDVKTNKLNEKDLKITLYKDLTTFLFNQLIHEMFNKTQVDDKIDVSTIHINTFLNIFHKRLTNSLLNQNKHDAKKLSDITHDSKDVCEICLNALTSPIQCIVDEFVEEVRKNLIESIIDRKK